jgi:hypothetical protein
MRNDIHSRREYAFRLHPKRWKQILEVQRLQDHPEGDPFPPALNKSKYETWKNRLTLKKPGDTWKKPITPDLPANLADLLSALGFQLHGRSLERAVTYSELHKIMQTPEFDYQGQIPTYEEFVNLLKKHWPKDVDLVVGPYILAHAKRTKLTKDGKRKVEPAAYYDFNLPASCEGFVLVGDLY